MSQNIWDKIRTVLVGSPIEAVYICGDIDASLHSLLNKVSEFYTQNIVIRTSIYEYEEATKLLDIYSNLKIDFIVNEMSIFESIVGEENTNERISFTIPIFSIEDLPQSDSFKSRVRYIPLIYDIKKQNDLIEAMLLSYDDVLESSNSIETCLIKDIVNTNFWGNITISLNGILSDGNKMIGNLYERSAYSILAEYLQLPNNKWMYTRNKYLHCKDCVFTAICPNVSIYEMQGLLERACNFMNN